jgi:GxxExxY protein
MGKCSKCNESGHTIRTCSKRNDSVLLDNEILERFQDVVDMCNEVATSLKKGFSEGMYEEALCVELQLRNIQYSTQEVIPITYKNRYIGSNRLDIILHNWCRLIIELKATSAMKNEDKWQLVRYMSRKEYPYGVVVNFNQSTHGKLELCFIVCVEAEYYQFNVHTRETTKLVDM